MTPLMTRRLSIIPFVICLLTFGNALAQAQGNGPIVGEKCAGKIYGPKDVWRSARITDLPSLTIPEEASDHDVHGEVIVNAILCRNGRVTDIQVVKGLPFGVTENAIGAVRNTRFAPAEVNFHSVSQRLQFQFSVNPRGFSEIEGAAAAGR